MSSVASARRARALGALAAAAVLGACGAGDVAGGAPAPAAFPPGRPDDGLLSDTALQRLVDLQTARDGAPLIARLDAPAARVRARAAFALGSVQDRAAVPALLGLLDDPAASVRADAAFAVGRSAGPDAVDPLLAALEVEDDPAVRALTLEAVAKIGSTGTDARLLSAGLPEADPFHPGAEAVARALARLGVGGSSSSGSVEWLVDALIASDGSVRREAAYYFGRVPTVDPWAARAPAVRAALDGYGDGDPAAMHLVAALGALGAPEDAGRVLGWLERAGDWRIRTNAARAVSAWRGRADVRRALLAALADPSPHVVLAAAGVLAPEIRRDPELGRRAERWLEEHPERWRGVGPLLAALGRTGRGAALVEWMERWPDDAALPRSRVLEALAHVDGERADSVLVEAARAPRATTASAALRSLARRWTLARGDPALEVRYERAFRSALESGHPVVRRLAADVLAERTGREVRLPGGASGEPGAGSPPPSTVEWRRLAELGSRPRLVLHTDEGRVVVELDAEEAPLTVQTVSRLARDGRYGGVPFHRVVPNFVVQGGDVVRGDGRGGPGFTIRSELTRIPFRRGVIGMASAGKDTESSQYFLAHSMQPHLDGGYTSFGRVIEGMDVVDRLVEGQAVRSATVEPGG